LQQKVKMASIVRILMFLVLAILFFASAAKRSETAYRFLNNKKPAAEAAG
jgi:uncharacterized protein YacL